VAINVGTAVAYLDLNMTAFNSGIQQAQSALQTFESNTAGVGQKLVSAGGLLSNVGSSITRNVSVPIANLGESSIQAYRDFESAFAGVKKTIDESRFKEYSVSWDDLSNAIKQMAQETGISAEEIAGVMEVAGQLGVELGDGGKNIIEFTRQMTMLGVATDMTAEDASLSLARFANITGLFNTTTDESAKNVQGLGSAITALGNNFATQEAEIVNMSTRLASAGTVSGLTAQEILALATAMSSAGIKAEAGGSSMSTTLTNLEQIVEGVAENAEEKLETLGYISGMGAEQFAETWKNDPIKAVEAFIRGLGNVNTEGESMVLFLDELGMKSIRQSNMLRALALSADNMSEALQVSNATWNDAYADTEKGSALVEEFNKRMETLDSRLGMLNETWKDVKREIAEVLLPYLEMGMQKLQELLSWWKQLDDETKESIVKFTALAAAIGPVLMVLGNLISSIGTILGVFQALSPVVHTVTTVFGQLSAETNILKGVLDLVRAGISGLSVPMMAIIAIIGLVIAAVVDLWKNNEEFRNNVKRIWDAIVDLFKSVWDALKPIFETLFETFKLLVKAIEPIIELLVSLLVPAIEMVVAILKPVIKILSDVIRFVLEIVNSILKFLIPIIQDIIEFIGTLSKAIMDFIKFIGDGVADFFNFISGVVETAVNVISGLWDKLCSFMVSLWDNTVGKVIQWVKDLVDGIVGKFKELWNNLFGDPIVVDICNGLTKWFGEALEAVFGFVKDCVSNVINKFKELADKLKEVVSDIVSGMKERFSAMVANIKDNVNKAKEHFANFAQNAKQKFSEVGTNIKNFFTETGNKFSEWRKNWAEKTKEFAENFVSKIKEKTDETFTNFSNFFGDLLSLGWSKMSDFLSLGTNLMNSLGDGLKSAWEGISDWIGNAFSHVSDLVGSIKEKARSVSNSVFGWINGSHANGLSYVPFDGYIAELHKGERVLTAQENRAYSSGGVGGSTINFYSNEKIDEYTAARELKRAIKDINLGLV